MTVTSHRRRDVTFICGRTSADGFRRYFKPRARIGSHGAVIES